MIVKIKSLYPSVIAVSKIVLIITLMFITLVPNGYSQEPSNTSFLDHYLETSFLPDLTELVAIPTWRKADFSNEKEVERNLAATRDYLKEQVEIFNANQKHAKLRFFEHRLKGRSLGDYGVGDYWLFGFRIGSGPKKLSLMTHLDTVSPGADWPDAFALKQVKDSYQGKEVDFLLGRGAIDNKGPAVVTLQVLKAIAREYDSPEALEGLTIEVLFDTSEETEMATPHYLKKYPEEEPAAGIVFDAMWCIRAEKGIERPVFSVAARKPPTKGLWIESLTTPKIEPTNQIPSGARLVVRAAKPELLHHTYKIYARFEEAYRAFDPEVKNYRKAPFSVEQTDDLLTVAFTTSVLGAQHGSAPHENLEGGVNPLVSMLGFVDHLVKEGEIQPNHISDLASFLWWGWGVTVQGEKHPELLYANDEIFEVGTTYALTKINADEKQAEAAIDIRYAIDHHESRWDGKTEGFLPGKESKLNNIFNGLLEKYNKVNEGIKLSFATKTLYPPDIRLPSNPHFKRLNQAYQKVTGESCPLRAIGGGTDAKGHTQLFAAGPLMTGNFGPPINYHGHMEKAPLDDLKVSAKILYGWLKQQVDGVE